MSDAISRFDAQKLVYDYCHARTVEGRQLKSPAVFTTHTGTDLAEAIGALPALPALPALQPDAAAIREAALREAASYHEVMAADEDALSAKYRGGSSPWFAHVQRASWHREHASAILALKGESHE